LVSNELVDYIAGIIYTSTSYSHVLYPREGLKNNNIILDLFVLAMLTTTLINANKNNILSYH